MIKEKTVYYSTETGKEYGSLTEAIREDNAAGSQPNNAMELLQKFESAKNAFHAELRSAREESEKVLGERIAEIHTKYDDVLNQLAEQLSKCDIDLSDVSQGGDGDAQNRHPRKRIKSVKVHVMRDPNRF